MWKCSKCGHGDPKTHNRELCRIRQELAAANKRVEEAKRKQADHTPPVYLQRIEELARERARLRRLVARVLHTGMVPDPHPIGGWDAWEEEAEALGITFEEAVQR